MKTLLKYNTDEYKISQVEFDSNLTAKSESMMALGNGYLGLRSVDEEVESFNKEDLFVNGIFNKDAETEVSELANLADSIQTPIFIDGERLSLNKDDEYLKEIALKVGTLTRKVGIIRNNKSYELSFVRFVSQNIENFYAQKIEIKQIQGDPSKIVLMPRINGQTTNSGSQHFVEGQKKRTNPTSVQYIEETNFSQRVVVHNLITETTLNGKKLEGGTDDYVITMGRRQVGFKIQTEIKPGDILLLEKRMSVNTTIDDENNIRTKEQVEDEGMELFHRLEGASFNVLKEKSDWSWKDVWSQFNLNIIGDSDDAKYDRLSFVSSVFHMNSFVPTHNSNLSVGAKGLSGEGYQGHSFWDTEFFVVPNYLYTSPQVAKNLLIYRYKGIEGARAKAMEKKVRPEESELQGAQYPWEMAWPTDGEVCPYWGQADVVTGKQEPIASRRQEIHVPADIAFAVDQYYHFTNDVEFMNEMGFEMIIDTAIFWAHRAEKNLDGSYSINDVMGPNEYKGNINNNAYINAFAKKNLELAIFYIDSLSKTPKEKRVLDKVIAKIPYEVPVELMKDVITNLRQQTPNEKGIIAENDQFLSLKRMDVTPFQLLGDAGKKLFNTAEGHKRLSSQLVKQADVVLLTYLLPQNFSKDVVKKNFEFYEPVTTHDSSLSPTTYAIQAIDLRKMDLGYKLFRYANDIDMGPNMASCNAGIHAGSQAAVWQSIVYGFGGLRWIEGKLHINPILPKQWEGLEYNIKYRSQVLNVKVEADTFTLSTEGGKIAVVVDGKEWDIDKQGETFEVKHD